MCLSSAPRSSQTTCLVVSLCLCFLFVLPFSGICHVYDGLSSQVAKSTLQDQTLSDRFLK